jgi:hypothetical protein
MPIAAAKAAQGDVPVDNTAMKKEDMSGEKLAAREEFDLNEDPVSKAELWSWYGYDFAVSVYHSVVLVMFFPVLQISLAEMYGCPYTYQPTNLNHTDGGESNSISWNGHQNSSTTCHIKFDESENDFDVR